MTDLGRYVDRQYGGFFFIRTCIFSNNGKAGDLDKFCQISLIDAWYGKNKNFLKKNFPFAMEVKMCFFGSFRIRKWIRIPTRQKCYKLPDLRHGLYMFITLMWFWIFVHIYHCLPSVGWVSPYIEQKRLNFFGSKSCEFEFKLQLTKALWGDQIFVVRSNIELQQCGFGFLCLQPFAFAP